MFSRVVRGACALFVSIVSFCAPAAFESISAEALADARAVAWQNPTDACSHGVKSARTVGEKIDVEAIHADVRKKREKMFCETQDKEEEGKVGARVQARQMVEELQDLYRKRGYQIASVQDVHVHPSLGGSAAAIDLSQSTFVHWDKVASYALGATALLACRRPRLAVCAALPVVVDPTIVRRHRDTATIALGYDMWRYLPDKARKAILAHEMAHSTQTSCLARHLVEEFLESNLGILHQGYEYDADTTAALILKSNEGGILGHHYLRALCTQHGWDGITAENCPACNGTLSLRYLYTLARSTAQAAQIYGCGTPSACDQNIHCASLKGVVQLLTGCTHPSALSRIQALEDLYPSVVSRG